MKKEYAVPQYIIEEFNKVNQEKNGEGGGTLSKKQANKQIEETLMRLENMNLSVSNHVILGAQPYSTILEAKLLRIVLSQIYSGDQEINPETVNLTYTVRVKDLYQKLMPGNKSNKNSIYDTVKKTVIGLQSRLLFIREPESGKWRSINWTAETSYENGKVSITLNEKLVPYIKNLKGNFSVFSLDTLVSFKNKYAMRIYEGLHAKIYRDIKTRNGFLSGKVISVSFNIDEFKVVSSTVGMYTGISMLKAKCINPAVKEITEKTDIIINHVEYLAKTQRATDTIKFFIQQKEDPVISEKAVALVNAQDLFDDARVLTKDYILSIMEHFGLTCDVDLDNLIRCYLLNQENAVDFNRDFQVAYKNATASVSKYLEAMVLERQKKVKHSVETLQVNMFASAYDSNDEVQSQKNVELAEWQDVTDAERKSQVMLSTRAACEWDTAELGREFDEIVAYWGQKKAAIEQTIPEEYLAETPTLKAIKRTDRRHRRHFYELLEEGETPDTIKEAIDVAAVSAWYLRVSGNFSYFINPRNYFDIAAGERDYDSEAVSIWKKMREN